MIQPDAQATSTFENLDRSVLFATIGGVVFNGMLASLSGIMLTIIAAMLYGLARNRITNMDAFDCTDTLLPNLPGVNIQYFTLWCQWLASRQLHNGLLGDLVDPAIGGTPGAARRYIWETLFLNSWIRAKEKIMCLLWLDHHL